MIRNSDIRRLNRLVLELTDQLLEERPGIWVGDLFNFGVKPHEVCEARSELIGRVRSKVEWRHERGTHYQQIRINNFVIDAEDATVRDDSEDRWKPASLPMIAKLMGAKVHSTILLIERKRKALSPSDEGAPKAPGAPGGDQ